MESLEWQEAFSVNHAQLDAQHQRIFNLANELFLSIRDGRSEAVLKDVLDTLADYTATHFKDEEMLMEAVRFPKLAAHKAQHEVLLLQLDELRKRFHDGDRVMATELFHFVVNKWLFNHILSQDSQYAPYLKADR